MMCCAKRGAFSPISYKLDDCELVHKIIKLSCIPQYLVDNLSTKRHWPKRQFHAQFRTFSLAFLKLESARMQFRKNST